MNCKTCGGINDTKHFVCDNCNPFRNRRGEAVGIEEMVASFGQGMRDISREILPNGIEISTVHMGIYAPCSNHCRCNKSLFETWVHDDSLRERWHTVKEAIEGHKRIVKELS